MSDAKQIVEYDTIVIGAGAAGLFCARTAGMRGKRVLLLDHATQIGHKILISGGGRCNFTNLHTTPEDFYSANPHFCKSALSQFTPHHFLQLVQNYKIAHHPKAPGQLFCDGSAKEILLMLLTECRKANVNLKFPVAIQHVTQADTIFTVQTDLGEFKAPSLVVATGGVSFPKLGATDLGYRLAKQFGHTLTQQSPALVGFATTGPLLKLCQELSGLTLPVRAKLGKKVFSDGLVLTHFGMSGPALLNLSLFWQPGQNLALCFMPEVDLPFEILRLREEQPKLQLNNAYKKFFPDRFVDAWLDLLAQKSEELGHYAVESLQKRAFHFQNFDFSPTATAGYARAEVTRGGVSVDELSSKTLESKRVSGLYFIGEVLDVTGRLGGFNFQWAWSSGFVVGSFV